MNAENSVLVVSGKIEYYNRMQIHFVNELFLATRGVIDGYETIFQLFLVHRSNFLLDIDC